jgi:hypothetical protein
MTMGEKHVYGMYGILVYMLWIRNLEQFGKTMDLALFLTCMLCWTLEWHFGMPFGVPLCTEAQPDFLYKEQSFHCWDRNLRNLELKLRMKP